MRSFLRLLCAFGMAGLLAVDVFFFLLFTLFIDESNLVYVRQRLNVFICQPQDFLANGLSVISPPCFSLLCATFCFAR